MSRNNIADAENFFETASKEELIDYLVKTIQKEVSKGDDADCDLVRECSDWLEELTEDEVTFTPEELEHKLEELKAGSTSEKPVKIRKKATRKTFVRVALIAAVIFAISLASLSTVAMNNGYGSAWEYMYQNISKLFDMPSGKKIREALSGKLKVTPLEMAEMFACDRAIHNTHPEEGINRALADGITVISDRYYYSSLAYQGAALGYETVAALNLDNPDIRTPDLCVFLDLTPEKSLERIGKRGEATEIYENFDYLTRTRAMFFDVFERLRARGENIAVIDAYGSVSEVSERVLEAVLAIL